MSIARSAFAAAACAVLAVPAVAQGVQDARRPVGPLPGFACSLLKGTAQQLRTLEVPVYDKPDPQARRPLRTAAGVVVSAPTIVLTRHPRVVERGMVAVRTYDGRDGWVAEATLGAPLPLPPVGEDFAARQAGPHSVTATCQPTVFADGHLGAG